MRNECWAMNGRRRGKVGRGGRGLGGGGRGGGGGGGGAWAGGAFGVMLAPLGQEGGELLRAELAVVGGVGQLEGIGLGSLAGVERGCSGVAGGGRVAGPGGG